MRHFIIYISFSLFCFASFGQKTKTIVDTSQFKLDTTIKQNKCIFFFWKGSKDSTHSKLCIEKVSLNKHKIIFLDYIRDNDYGLTDINDDGFIDFVTFYHDHDIIHFFNRQTNSFSENVVRMPSTFSKIDKTENIYWGFHETMYADKYSYSILYKYKDTTPIFFYKLVFVTKEYYESMDNVLQIKLYKFKNNDYSKPIFIKNIKTNRSNKFDYELYWKKNYKKLLGSS